MNWPFNDMTKMFTAPAYILFQVLINNETYFGRVIATDMGDINHMSLKKGKFNVYESVEHYKKDKVLNQIEIYPNEFTVTEAIDTISSSSPTSLANLILHFNELELIPNSADLGLIRRNIPEILDRLIHSVEDFSTEHTIKDIDRIIEIIEEFKSMCKNISIDLNEDNRSKLIVTVKNGISIQIDKIIKYS